MRKTLLIALPLFAAAFTAHADVVQMPAQPEAQVVMPPEKTQLPKKGMTMAAVTKKYGAPGDKHPPAGGDSPRHPPITRWDYTTFSVFFENDHVVDAVIPTSPAELHHLEELRKN